MRREKKTQGTPHRASGVHHARCFPTPTRSRTSHAQWRTQDTIPRGFSPSLPGLCHHAKRDARAPTITPCSRPSPARERNERRGEKTTTTTKKEKKRACARTPNQHNSRTREPLHCTWVREGGRPHFVSASSRQIRTKQGVVDVSRSRRTAVCCRRQRCVEKTERVCFLRLFVTCRRCCRCARDPSHPMCHSNCGSDNDMAVRTLCACAGVRAHSRMQRQRWRPRPASGLTPSAAVRRPGVCGACRVGCATIVKWPSCTHMCLVTGRLWCARVCRARWSRSRPSSPSCHACTT